MDDIRRKTPMPELDPALRVTGFEEVAQGYDEGMALREATRCLDCRHRPCVAGCPVGIDIPTFIRQIKEGDPGGAYATLKQSNALPAVCGRVCPQENQCEKVCVRAIQGEPVGIGRLERYAADWHRLHEEDRPSVTAANGHRVAVVGSGPASLTCADELAGHGYEATILEALHRTGGVLTYGIPPFRLPKDIVEYEVDTLRKKGVRILTNFVVGRTATLDQLFADGYEAIFIGAGAGLPSFLGVPGENLNGVFTANEFLTRVNLMKAYRDDSPTPLCDSGSIVVVGGGNVALDAARCARRICRGDVTIVYRRSREEMPARREEIHHAIEEGVHMRFLTNPIGFTGDASGRVSGVDCVEMELGEPDATGRRRPVAKAGTHTTLACDTVIVAIGTSPNPLLRRATPQLAANERGSLVVDPETGMTSMPGVFAGGDIVSGDATVILAMGAGKRAAAGIDAYIRARAGETAGGSTSLQEPSL